MGRSLRKKMLSFLTVFLIITAAVLPVHAEETDPGYVTEGTYLFQSNEGYGRQLTDSFQFREDCFMRSSFLGCEHLALLSSQAALASSSKYAEDDPAGAGYGIGYQNIEEFLEAMDFEDVEHNQYYEQEKLENSCGAAIGHRTIEAFGKTYTLLAVIPRSAGYKQEWAGDLTVDGDGLHGGFRDGRDECLRFLKQYIQKHGIRGDLKFWVPGHSRGAAIANLIAGFLAGGGIAYLGEEVSVTPEDIYCYGMAAPTCVKDGMDKNDELSVAGSGSRSHTGQEGSEAETNDYSRYDTPGEAYTYTGGGTLDLSSSVYKGIRNYTNRSDFISMSPPEFWGFTYYGSDTELASEDLKESMLAELRAISPVLYEKYLAGDDAKFARKTFDPSTLQIVDDKASHSAENMHDFMEQRIAGLFYATPTNAQYAALSPDGESRQNAMRHLGGLYGMLESLPGGIIKPNLSDLIFPVITAFLAYGSERVMAEKNITSEEEAVEEVLLDLIRFLSGTSLEKPCTVDDAFASLAVYLNGSETLKSEMLKSFPESTRFLLADLVNDMFETDIQDAKAALDFLITACAEGYTDKSGKQVDAAKARQIFYENTLSMLKQALAAYLPILEAFDPIAEGEKYAQKPFSAFAAGVCTVLKSNPGKDPYGSLGPAADAALSAILDKLINDDVLSYARKTYGEMEANDLLRHKEGLKNNLRELREGALYGAFYVPDEPFSTASAAASAATFYNSLAIIPAAHYYELSTAWLRANVKAGRSCDHWIMHVPEEESSCEEEGIKEHWHYHESDGDKDYTDRVLSEEITDIVIPPKGHSWDSGVVTREPTETEEGVRTYTCKVCGKKRREPIPKLTPKSITPSVITCQDAGYPAGFAWNEAANACQPGWLDSSGVFHPASQRVRVVNTYDPGIRKYTVSLLLSLITAFISFAVLLRMKGG